MNFVYYVTVFCFVFCASSFSFEDEPKRRQKRYLRYIEGSKYFIRLNSKHNLIPELRVFAEAIGFRVNYEAPKKVRGTRHKIARRDLYQNLETLIMHHGSDGRACVLKTFCYAYKILKPESGIILKLFKKFFTFPRSGDENYFKYEECDILDGHCPFSIFNLVRFTDD